MTKTRALALIDEAERFSRWPMLVNDELVDRYDILAAALYLGISTITVYLAVTDERDDSANLLTEIESFE